jgi:AGZA family xanthine/uracil permease-like MFS transporter
LLPLFAFIPSAVIKAGEIYLSMTHLSILKKIDFLQLRQSLPSYLTIVGIVFFYSVNNGICVGVLSFVVINIIAYVFDVVRYFMNKLAFLPKFPITFMNLIWAMIFIVEFFVPKE